VRRRLEIDDVARSTQTRKQEPIGRDLRRLGGVLRYVPGGSADVVLRETDYLELRAPANALAGGGYLNGLDGALDHALEQLRRAAARWLRTGVARAVEPNDCVVVNDTTPLELGGLHEPHAHDVAQSVTSDPELAREPSSDLQHRPLPEHGHEVVPRGLLEVAVRIRIDRRAQNLVMLDVPATARATTVTVPNRVGGTERRSGQRHHYRRVLAYRLGNALATSHARGNELERISSVDLSAGRAARCSPVAARNHEDTARLARRLDPRQELARLGVDAFVPTAEANRA
jgi:hypothetical protein